MVGNIDASGTRTSRLMVEKGRTHIKHIYYMVKYLYIIYYYGRREPCAAAVGAL